MTITYDRPRRAGEPVIDWALATLRVGASRADEYRAMIANGSVTETFVEALASPLAVRPADVKASPELVAAMRQRLGLPTTAGRDQIFAAVDALPAAGAPSGALTTEGERRIRERVGLPVTASMTAVLARVDQLLAAGRSTSTPFAAAVRNRFVAAASAPVLPPGVGAGLGAHFAANPLVEHLAVGESALFDLAVTERPTPPTLFAGGDLPAYTASGLDPAELVKVPWYARHAVAEATTLGDAQELIDFYSGPDGVAMAAETRRHPGNRQYEDRVWEWVGTAEEAAALREQAAATPAGPGSHSVGVLAWEPDAADLAATGDAPAGVPEELSMDAWAQQLGVDARELSAE